ncbi:hypothetical protein N7456_009506 [Penicillium angulare]|uniref:NACHT domain-containing protein n=1 Tax=Penicillium angulare TaxID=116970 RepID=A0A9W9K5M2_9EURO|nr:hypothetical protein N7456_009506 [Penicillium angulare]
MLSKLFNALLLGVLWTTLEQELKPRVERIQKYYEVFECELWSARVRGDEQDLEGRFTEQEAVEGESKLRSLISRAGDKLSILESGQGQIDKRRAKKRKQQLLDSLSTHDYLTPLKQSRRKRHGGTAEWLFEMQEFDHWMSGTDCPVIFCSGKIGSGKTVLAASLIDRILIEKHDPDIFVSFFFVRFDDHESLKSENILKSILWQALDKTGLPDWVDILLEAAQGILSYELENLVKMLDMVAKSLKRLYIIIDGLDECQKRERDDLLNALTSLLSVKPDPNIRVFLSGRESVSREVERSFPELKRVSMNCQIAQSNISTYIEGAIKGKLHSEDLVVGNKDLIEEIKEALRNGADGIDADHHTGEMCVTYLNFNDFKTKIVPKPKPPPRLDIAPIEIARTALKNEQRSQDYLQRIAGLKLDSEEYLASIDVAERLANLQRDYAMSPTRGLQLKHRFLAYASVNMILHTSDFEKGISKTWDIWKNMIVHGHEHISYPWGDRLFNPNDPIMLRWALKKKQYALIRLIYTRMVGQSVIRQIQRASAVEGDNTLLDISLPSATRHDIDQLLHPAILFDHPQVVERLLTEGADPNAKGDKWTALNLAARCGFPDVLEVLLAAGANPNAEGPDIERSVRVPLQAAAWKGHLYAVDRLLMAGANVNGGSDGETALLLAADSGHLDVVQRLQDAGADVSIRSAVTHRTPIQHAVQRGYVSIVKRLLAAGADVNTGVKDGDSLLMIAIDRNHFQILDVLIAAGASVNVLDNPSPLEIAASHGNVTILNKLLAAGANANSLNGSRALKIAIDNRYIQIVDRLKASGAREISSGFTRGSKR